MTLNEQVAKAKGWERKEVEEWGLEDEETGEPEINTREAWVDENGNIRSSGIECGWTKDLNKAFELIEEMGKDENTQVYITSPSGSTEWLVTVNSDFYYGKTPQEAICRAYIAWKKDKK